jgi:general secretion pathway protein F
MPVFEYKGLTGQGREIKGIIDADNPQTARAKLKKDGVYLTDIKLGKEERLSKDISPFREKISGQDIAIMTRQFSTLIGSGIPIVDSLSALIDQVSNMKFKSSLSVIRDKVNEGSSLADAMKDHPKIFTNIYMNMIKAGESSGTLEIVLERLAEFTEGQNRLKNKIISILAYPVVVMAISMLVLFFLLTTVVPKVTKIYDNMKQSLPLPTEILLFITNIFSHYWWLLIILIGAVYYFTAGYLKTPQGKAKFDRFVLKIPIIGEMVRMVAVSRFASTFSTLLSAGVPVLQSMDIVKNIVNNTVFAEVVQEARANIAEGQSIAEPLKKSGIFPPLVTHMIAIGEKTGELEAMLKKVSETYSNQFESRIQTLTALMEPIIIVVMAALIGFIVISMLLPLIQLSSTI